MLVLLFLIGVDTMVSRGHPYGVSAAVMSRDGRFIYSSGRPAAGVKIWEVASGRLLKDLRALSCDGLVRGKGATEVACVTPRGATMLDVSKDTVRQVAMHGVSGASVSSISESADGTKWIFSTGSNVFVADPSSEPITSKRIAATRGNTDWGRLDGRGARVALLDTKLFDNRIVRVFDTQSGVELFSKTLPFYSDDQPIAISNDGDSVAVTEKRGSVLVFSIKKKTEQRVAVPGARQVRDLRFNDDASLLFVSQGTRLDNDEPVRELIVFRVADGSVAFRRAMGDGNNELFLGTSPDGRMLLHGSLTLRDAKTLDVVRTLGGSLFESGRALAYSLDGRRLYANNSNTFRAWDLATAAPAYSLPLAESGSAFDAPRKHALLILHPQAPSIVDLATGQVKHKLPGDFDNVRGGVALSPDATRAAVRQRDTIHVFKDGKRMCSFNETRMSYGLGFSGNRLMMHTRHTVEAFDGNTCQALPGKIETTQYLSEPMERTWAAAEPRFFHTDTKIFELTPTALVERADRRPTPSTLIGGVAISPDRQFAAVIGQTNGWRLDKLPAFETVYTQPDEGVTPRSVSFDPSRRHLAMVDNDGIIDVLDYTTLPPKPVVRLIGRGEDFASVTPDGYYRASKGGRQFIHYVQGLQTFSFDNFDARFNRPDLVVERLGRATPEAVQLLKRAHEQRMKKLGFSAAQAGALRVPELSVDRTKLGLDTAAASIELPISASDAALPLVRLLVTLNGVPVLQRAVSGARFNETLKIDLATGPNRIAISVFNAEGVESRREEVFIRKQGAATPHTYAAVIGVSAYKDASKNLEYAAKDAEDVARVFGDTLILTNAAGTREALDRVRAHFAKAGIDDRVVLFIAGHGLLDAQLDYWFATHDIDFDAPAARGIAYAQLERIFDGTRALQRVLLMDTCHAGEVDKDAVALAGTLASGVKVRAVRGVVAKRRVGTEASVDGLRELFSELRQTSGAFVIASSGGAEYALESTQLKNGVFTYSLLEALQKKPMLSELMKEVARRVGELTNGAQRPAARSDNPDYDFRLN